MKKYTIIIIDKECTDEHYDEFDDVLFRSKQLSKKGIYHIIKDNQFNTSVKMCEK